MNKESLLKCLTYVEQKYGANAPETSEIRRRFRHRITCSALRFFRPKECIMLRRCFLRLGITMGFAVGLLIGADALKANVPEGEKALQGTWKLSAGEADGKELPENQLKDGKLVIKGDDYAVTLADNGTVKGTQKLDPTKEPKTIDTMDASGPNKGKTCLGIYELKGDEFRVVFAPLGKPRPTKFTTAADSGQWMHVWKRVK